MCNDVVVVVVVREDCDRDDCNDVANECAVGAKARRERRRTRCTAPAATSAARR
jgi:hypothetical protein